jgi:hypothetical protein
MVQDSCTGSSSPNLAALRGMNQYCSGGISFRGGAAGSTALGDVLEGNDPWLHY